ncbi:MAG: ABC-ATPase domain-containing protein [Methanomassiliicoccaceae archaeon]|jgi:predicted ABC-class ATPase|nr:ABC-ATPase domain-containing protein [Methanomassiliicoccaceae archaeon]
MASKDQLVKSLQSADGKPYNKYKELAQFYELDDITLYADKIQNEPSSYSEMRVRISFTRSGFPDDTHDTSVKETALRDLIARRFWESCRMFAKGNSAGEHGGMISIPRPGQEILERSCVVMTEKFIEVRFKASLPAAGRNAAGRSAVKMLTEDLAEITKASLFFSSYKRSKLYNHLNTLITSRNIRSLLREKGLVAFIADGSILPRRADGLAPMSDAVPFASPVGLRVTFETADGEAVRGMGIPEGLTAIIGATYQGKSTLIDAIASGVHDHIPGDGRELVITVNDAAVVSRDEGRSVRNVDASLFISDPSRNTASISTDNADDALSSAISAAEAMEIGCRLLLIDDMSVNHSLLYRDATVSKMIPKGDETIIPITEWIRGSDISAIIACRHGDLVGAADTVIVVSKHIVSDAAVRKRSAAKTIERPPDRLPLSRNMSAAKGRNEVNSIVLSASKIEFGETVIKLPVPLPDICQTAAVADVMIDAKEMMDGSVTMRDLVKRLEDISRKRINSADVNIGPDRAMFRIFDIAAVINRHSGIVVAQKTKLC